MVLLTVFGQVVFKWQAQVIEAMPEGWVERFWFMVRVALNPWILASYGSAFLASLFWWLALRTLDLSHAYPFTTLSYVLVLILSGLLFREAITAPKILGMILIIAGMIIASRG